MNLNHQRPGSRGYTLLELMMVMAIIALLISIVVPRYDLVLVRAYQAKTKSNLATLRTSINLYYSDTEGSYPLGNYPEGDTHYTSDQLGLSVVLSPRWLDYVPLPLLKDRAGGINVCGSCDWDIMVKNYFSQDPPNDVYIIRGEPDYPLIQNLISPYAYDNHKGWVYIANGNFDSGGHFYFYQW